jgi:hypothetical protein
MTLAVAACGPWKRLRSAFPLAPFEQAVILSTDSRVTAPPKPPKDNSAKAYWLARYCGLVYAGDVGAAEASIKPLRSYLRRLPARMNRDPFQELTVIIREAYAGEQERVRKGDRLPLGVLDVLVGICDREGRAWALKMSSHGQPDDAGTRHLAKDPFEQIPGVGAQAIGESRAVRTFHETLASREQTL